MQRRRTLLSPAFQPSPQGTGQRSGKREEKESFDDISELAGPAIPKAIALESPVTKANSSVLGEKLLAMYLHPLLPKKS